MPILSPFHQFVNAQLKITTILLVTISMFQHRYVVSKSNVRTPIEREVLVPSEDGDNTMQVPALSPNYDPWTADDESSNVIRGVDESFPTHHLNNNTGRQTFYEHFINGCVEKYGPKKGQRCIETEKDRIDMSLRQPQSMVNYTEVGYKKIRAPEPLRKLLTDFWNRNKDSAKVETWGIGNTYTNNWAAPTSMVSVEDSGLRGGGYSLKQQLWDAAKTTIMEWTGQDLTPCSLYGIRIYKEGAVLAPHVDRLPLVSSAIVNVAQDLDEPWPLEVIAHNGRAENVTMLPGDMVLYESHSVLHGRPFPLKGRFMANIFIHFEPTGHSLRHHGVDFANSKQDERRLQRGVGGHENYENTGLPPYIVPGTPEEDHWIRMNPSGYQKQRKSFTTGSTIAHSAAKVGAVEELKQHIANNKNIVRTTDENGWTPLHEAVRGGHDAAVRLLVEHGADVNFKTSNGATALWWAKKQHNDDHPVVSFLQSIGALYDGPEL